MYTPTLDDLQKDEPRLARSLHLLASVRPSRYSELILTFGPNTRASLVDHGLATQRGDEYELTVVGEELVIEAAINTR